MTVTTVIDSASESVEDLDPYDLAVLENPESVQRAIREAAPVVWLKKYDIYAMGRYEHVRAALRNWQDFESGAGVGLSNWRKEKPWRPQSIVNEADPPHQDAPRNAIAKILTRQAIRRLTDAWAEDAVDVVDSLLARTTTFDLVGDLAAKFPIRVFPDAVGLEPDGRENLIPYSEHAFNSFGPQNELVAKNAPRIPSIVEWISRQCQRDVLTPDGFGAQLWAASDRREITPEQVPLLIRSLLTAGVDTTIIGLSAALALLARNPDAWDQLRANPLLAHAAFDEAVRIDSPVQTLFRTTTREVNVEGTTIPAESKVLLIVAAANHDPRRWDDPDTYDLARDSAGHLGFGMGIHQCVGQHLARLEAQSLLTALAQRVRRISVVGTPRRHLNNTLRGWESVPVEVELV